MRPDKFVFALVQERALSAATREVERQMHRGVILSNAAVPQPVAASVALTEAGEA